MKSDPLQSDASPPPTRVLAALVLAAGLALWASSLADGAWSGGLAPFPFAWQDVALVHIAGALPVGWVAAAFIRRRWGDLAGVAAAAAGLGAAALLMSRTWQDLVLRELIELPWMGAILRAAPAIGIALWGGAIAQAFLQVEKGPGRPKAHVHPWPLITVSLLCLFLAPWVYVCARCRHDLNRLGACLPQSRFGEAQNLVFGLLMLDGQSEYNRVPMVRVAGEVERRILELEERVEAKLPVTAASVERLQRARDLAMLGRATEALTLLATVSDPAIAPEAALLAGSLHDSQGDGLAALASYERARAAWRLQPPSPERDQGLVRAVTGIAESQRSLGHYAAAEAAFQERLALAPTADSHFLMAQFFADSQHAVKARDHARRAMELAPAQYNDQGQRLIRELTVFQFGCWSVFSKERR